MRLIVQQVRDRDPASAAGAAAHQKQNMLSANVPHTAYLTNGATNCAAEVHARLEGMPGRFLVSWPRNP